MWRFSTLPRPFNRDGHIAWLADVPGTAGKYLALFNTRNPEAEGNGSERISVTIEELGLTGNCSVRDLWAKKDRGVVSGAIAADVPCHGAVLYRVSPTGAAHGPMRPVGEGHPSDGR